MNEVAEKIQYNAPELLTNIKLGWTAAIAYMGSAFSGVWEALPDTMTVVTAVLGAVYLLASIRSIWSKYRADQITRKLSDEKLKLEIANLKKVTLDEH